MGWGRGLVPFLSVLSGLTESVHKGKEMFTDYPVAIVPSSTGGFVATFRDVPEALAEGRTYDEAKKFAKEALVLSVDFYRDDFRPFPDASKAKHGEDSVHLPVSVAAKISLLNAMTAANCRPVDLARKMGVKAQDVTRILDIQHSTKIDTIEKALYSLGRKFSIIVS